MTLFDKDLVCNLMSQITNSVCHSDLKYLAEPINQEVFNWLQCRSDRDKAFNKVFELLDTGHPEAGRVLPADLAQRLIDAKGDEAEDLAIRMVRGTQPRIFKDPELRNRARRVKSVCNVGMRSIKVLGENGYYNTPENVSPMVRHSAYNKSAYDKLDGYGKDFSGSGFVELSGLVSRIIKHMKTLDESDLWLGFHRVKPELAAATLGRMHSVEWSDVFHLSCPIDRLPDFIVKSEEKIDLTANNEEMAAAVFLKSTAIRDRVKRDFRFVNLSYSPRMYPLHEFSAVPGNVEKIISFVEKMPELSDRPGFDYFWVLVPGFSLNHPSVLHPDGFYRIMLDGKLFETRSETEVSDRLDKQLIRDGVIVPCVLGEREGKCYFLTLWT